MVREGQRREKPERLKIPREQDASDLD